MTKPGDHQVFNSHFEMPDEGDLFKKRPSSQWDADDIFTTPFELAQAQLEKMSAEEEIPLELPQIKPGIHFSLVQVLLLCAIVLVGGGLFYFLFGVPGPRESMAESQAIPNDTELVIVEPVVSPGIKTEAPAEPNEEPVAVVPEPAALEGPVSLLEAETAYQDLALELAYAMYERLLEDLPTGRDHESLAAFLQLRMGFCMRGLGRLEAAEAWLKPLSQEAFPLIQAIIRYHQCIDRLRQQQYFPALQRGYQALSLADCVEDRPAWRDQFKQNCVFLVGEALTLQTLSQYDGDTEFPPTLWEWPDYQDPFLGQDEVAISQLVDNGSEAYRLARVGPRIERSPGDRLGESWRVVCNGASLDQFLKRFATHTLLDLDWSFSLEATSEIVDETVRQRPVNLFMRDVSPEEVAVLATGCSLLFADLSQGGVIRVIDPKPEQYRSLSRLRENLQHETLAHWQRVVLSDEVRTYSANAHYASALLLEYGRQTTEAITEYQLLANRFRQSSLSPYALLRSSRLRAGMLDFPGAREDLRHLVEMYPEVEFKSQAYLELATATRKAGWLGEAVTHYRTVYYMDAPLDETAEAALGAGQCHYARQEYREAARWLKHSVDAAIRTSTLDPAEGFLLMGRTLLALDRFDDARDALGRALSGDLSKEHYLEGLRDLIELDIRQGRAVEALNRLESDIPWDLSRNEINDIESLKARVLYAMGLPEKALLHLEDCLSYLNEAQQRGRIYFQMAQYYEANGEWNKALTFYSDVIDTIEPGPVAQQARIGLARARIHNQRYDQAVSLLRGLLTENLDPEIKAEADRLLIQAYQNNDQLNEAAELLLQQRRPTTTDSLNINGMPSDQTAPSDNQEVGNTL